MERKKVLLVSVGGSPSPVAYTINYYRPEFLIFFASRGSREKAVTDVIPHIKCKPKDYQFIVTPNEQDLEASVKVLLSGIPDILDVWALGVDDLVADYTGGTKTMSAAVVLALSRRVGSFSYVGGVERDKAGLGVVIDGREQMLYCRNPWDAMAVDTLREVAMLFNRCRFQSVKEIAELAARKADETRSFFEALAFVAEGYYLWDVFDYKKALASLGRGESNLRALTALLGDSPASRFHAQVAEGLALLGKIAEERVSFYTAKARNAGQGAQGVDGSWLLRDLVANAVRRAEVDHRYEEAVARLYSAIEKMAKVRLLTGYGIDTSDVPLDMVPDPALREEFDQQCRNERARGAVQLPLYKSFELLHALNDSMGNSFRLCEDDLRKVLETRNRSLLAHGFDPVRRETYEKLLAIALDFLGIEMSSLPSFPRMDTDWHLR